jgi:branched-chain amino acid transport system substrate-binding protein
MRTHKSLTIASIVLVLALLLSIGALPAAAQTPTPEPKYLTLGGITALSGPAAPWGITMQNAWQLLADQINAAGGMTVDGQQYLWQLKIYDHELDYAKSLTLARRLVQEDKAIAIFLFDGGCIKSAQEVTEAANVIVISYASPGKDTIGPDKPHTFQYGLDSDGAAVLYPWIAANTDIKKIAIFQPDTWTGDVTADAAAWAIGQTDLEIVYNGRGDEASTDFLSPLTAILATQPDMLDVSNWDPATGALIIKQARQLGFKGALHIITPDFVTLREVAGWENVEGAYLTPVMVTENETMQKFQADFKERYGEENWPGPFAYTMYDAIHWLTQAIQGSQSLDGTEIANYMATMQTKSIYGSPCYFGGAKRYGIDRIPLYPFYASTVKNGEVVEVISGILPDILK